MGAARGWTTVLVAFAALALAAVRAAPASRPDVVLIVVDTLRADRLGPYGNRRGLTPFLDTLVRRAHVIERAYAQAPWTSPSVASIFTSRYLSQHGVVAFNSVLAAEETTLAEVLRTAGYATGAFSANGLISRKAGFHQGFDEYRAHLLLGDPGLRFTRPAKRADEITEEALRWLDSVRAPNGATPPVFLYLHYMEPHAPYGPPPELLARVRAGKPPLDVARVNQEFIASALGPPSPEVLDAILDTYDAEVLAIDAALRRLMDALERRDVDALVVITADHGEEFRDHGGWGHGKTLYDELIHVPLIVRAPGQTHGGVIRRLVSSVDIAPTVLEVARLEIPASFEGVSFARDLDPGGTGTSLWRYLARFWDDRPRPTAFSEHYRQTEAEAAIPSHQSSVVLDGNKLITWTDGRREFFDLERDPREQQPNRVDPLVRDDVSTTLEAVRQRVLRNPTRAGTQTIDPRTREALRALGYLD
jgi:arylsulfatase A-like enzyme